MKSKIFFLISLLFLSIGAFCQSDTLQLVVNQSGQIAKDIIAGDLAFKVMIVCAIIGFLAHTFYDTKKGIKSTVNGTPFKFVLNYWLADNAYPKLISLVTIISGSAFLDKLLPSGTIGIIILGILSFIGGILLDWLTQWLNIDPKKTVVKG
jgi:hypothetical protein